MSFDGRLKNRVTIKKNNVDPGDDITISHSDTATSVPALIVPLGVTDSEEVFGKFSTETFTMFVEASEDVKPGYKVVDENSQEYDVRTIQKFEHRRAKLKEVVLQKKDVT